MAEAIINAVVSNAFELIGTILVIVVSMYVVPAMRNLVPWLKEKHMYDIVYKAVLAAEKLGDTSQIRKADKKEYVIELLTKKGITVTPEVESLIETACQQLVIVGQSAVQAIKDGN